MGTEIAVFFALFALGPAGCGDSAGSDAAATPGSGDAATSGQDTTGAADTLPDPDAPKTVADTQGTPIDTAQSYYRLELAVTGGLAQVYQRQLDDKPSALAFGSAHIAPAVSLAIEDDFPNPFAVVTINFGFVVGSNDHPVTIDDVGSPSFGTGAPNAPPGVKIQMTDQGVPRTFVSWETGASGRFVVTSWGIQLGDVVEGTIEGTLVDEQSVAKGEPVTATLSGTFRLIMPEPKR